jgi:TPR repeat protein
LIGAAKYYRKSAEFDEPSAENRFGICLEGGIGVHSNLILAARYHQRAAAHGNSDGFNNLGFCLEHGIGVEQDIEAAAEWYRFAHNNGHLESELKCLHCLRILGHWHVPDRSSWIVDSRPLDDQNAHLFIDCLKDSNINSELIGSIQPLKSTMPNGPRLRS